MKKNILSIIIIILVSAGLNSVSAQHNHCGTTGKNTQDHSKHTQQSLTGDTLKVYGNCDMCKKRIETAALLVSGVQTAEWNKTTKVLKVEYVSESKRGEVQKAILKAGHDLAMAKARDEEYNALPGCCKYRR